MTFILRNLNFWIFIFSKSKTFTFSLALHFTMPAVASKRLQDEGIDAAELNLNMCVDCVLEGLESILYAKTPRWCKFVNEDYLKYFDKMPDKPILCCTNCYKAGRECYQVGLLCLFYFIWGQVNINSCQKAGLIPSRTYSAGCWKMRSPQDPVWYYHMNLGWTLDGAVPLRI